METLFWFSFITEYILRAKERYKQIARLPLFKASCLIQRQNSSFSPHALGCGCNMTQTVTSYTVPKMGQGFTLTPLQNY